MRYEGQIFRPPSEADAYILQATIGCSWNHCTYCDMYRDKKFRVRDLNETLADIAGYPLAGLFVGLLGTNIALAFWVETIRRAKDKEAEQPAPPTLDPGIGAAAHGHLLDRPGHALLAG